MMELIIQVRKTLSLSFAFDISFCEVLERNWAYVPTRNWFLERLVQ